MKLNDVAKAAHDMAREKGFWDGDAGDVCKKLLLIHSEVTEAAEEYRKGNAQTYYTAAKVERYGSGLTYIGYEQKPEGIGPELADVLIRTLDLIQGMGMNAEALVKEKMEFNGKRGKLHGGKKF